MRRIVDTVLLVGPLWVRGTMRRSDLKPPRELVPGCRLDTLHAGAVEPVAGAAVQILDRDAKFARVFDDVFTADGVQTINTPIQASNTMRSPSAGCGRSGRSAWPGC
jgi:hypothetical protein